MEAMQTASPIENDTFWQRHYDLQKSSGLSRREYCRQHDLSYGRFGYWASKCDYAPVDKLISVKLRTEVNATSQAILCTLDLKGGHSLKIHDSNILPIILDRLG
jgi:hypothetical protein